MLPGGGYARQADHEAEPVAEWLASLGIHAFVLRYRVAPDRHPAPLMDAKEAMLYIRSGAHGLDLEPGRVGVLGFSAGGHLAATLSTGVATGSSRLDVDASVPDRTVLCYPVVSYTAEVHQGSVDNLLGDAPPSDLLAEVSAEQQVGAGHAAGVCLAHRRRRRRARQPQPGLCRRPDGRRRPGRTACFPERPARAGAGRRRSGPGPVACLVRRVAAARGLGRPEAVTGGLSGLSRGP